MINDDGNDDGDDEDEDGDDGDDDDNDNDEGDDDDDDDVNYNAPPFSLAKTRSHFTLPNRACVVFKFKNLFPPNDKAEPPPMLSWNYYAYVFFFILCFGFNMSMLWSMIDHV